MVKAHALALEPSQPEPQLQGQTQATAQPNGIISISELSLVARPGIYNVSVMLPDYPSVSILLCFLLVAEVFLVVVAFLLLIGKHALVICVRGSAEHLVLNGVSYGCDAVTHNHDNMTWVWCKTYIKQHVHDMHCCTGDYWFPAD